MSTYFINPYKMYYEKLLSAKQMPNSANKASECSENLSVTISSFQSQVESANWKERGYNELVTTSIPALVSRVEMMKNNITSGLLKAANQSINVLLPILEQIKGKDAELDNINSQLSKLVEPAVKYVEKKGLFGGKSNELTPEYSRYLSEKSKLEEQATSLKNELEPLKKSADSEIESIKALNDSVQVFDSTSETGEIAEIQGLVLTDAEKGIVDALEETVSDETEVENINNNEDLLQTVGNYPTGKTILYNDAGGKEYGYSRVILTSHGKKIKVFQQAWNEAGLRYRDVKDDIKTIRGAGCGYNALASIMSSKYPDITPERLFKEMGRKSLYSSSIKNHLEKNYGIKVGYRDDYPSTNPNNKYDKTNKKNNLIKELMKGNMVICTVNARRDTKYTRQGHWVSLVDYDPVNDMFYVTDSNDQDDSNAAPIDATRFLRDYEVSSNVIFIADDSGYRERSNA